MPTAVVTGAGSGIGRAVACALGNRGYSLALTGRRRDALHATAELIESPEVLVIPADLRDAAAASYAIDSVIAAFGGIDVLVNCAGDARTIPLSRAAPSDWAETMAANVSTAVHATQAAWPALQRSSFPGGPAVVSLASMAVFDPWPGLEMYGAAKAALAHLTRSWDAAGPVRAFCLCPGAVETEMLRRIASASNLPTARALQPRDVAGVVLSCIDGDRPQDRGKAFPVLPRSQAGWWQEWSCAHPSAWLGMDPVFA